MEKLFTSRDKLFLAKDGTKKDYSSINRYMGGTNDKTIWLLIRGYKEAGFELLDSLIEDTEGSWLNLDTKIYPLLFLFRHFLEMIMKDTIRFEKLIRRECHSDEVGFPPIHSLKDLWDELRPMVESRYENFDEELKQECINIGETVESLIKEIDELDRGSYAFRYPFDRPTKKDQKVKYSLPAMTIELNNLKNMMTKLTEYFEGINEQARVNFEELGHI